MTFLEAIKDAAGRDDEPLKIVSSTGTYFLMGGDGSVYTDDEDVDSTPYCYEILADGWSVEKVV